MAETKLATANTAEIGESRLTPGINAADAAAGEMPLALRGATPGAARRAIIIIHGRRRDAPFYADLAANAFCNGSADVLVIAPQFLTAADIVHHQLPATSLHWHETGWMQGEEALGAEPISAFAVLDYLIDTLADPSGYPVLEQIIIAGHSGGGQMVQRFAILTHTPHPVRFVVANPSSYAWFGQARPHAPPADTLATRWKYGLDARPAYGAPLDDDALEQRYINRDVRYLLGMLDCDPQHAMLDRSPAAMSQGANRLERGRNFWASLRQRHGAALRHHYAEIPDVGHEPAILFASPEARSAFWSSS
ncbi:S9 family peptidase [Acidiphilium sp. PA]|uniref:hypothetical protein n=1 Tax=Acidiphilium sp. PA TaxID=2871705 RepID=UPI0022435258|nr:hypothetical protein [Acidiphilium sp. PA]MCW8308640.1 S9 family peptidase [Acidiphilium sp. PA]